MKTTELMLLFFDTETTGKADFQLPLNDLRQPRIVQLASLFCDGDGHEIGSLSCLIKPSSWTIPEEATAVHGITTQVASDSGIEIATAIRVLTAWMEKSECCIGHNVEFDQFMVNVEFCRTGFESFTKSWPPLRCTMKMMTPICALPNPNRYKNHKWPKLQEAYLHAFGKKFDNAHDALADVRACKELWFWMKNL